MEPAAVEDMTPYAYFKLFLNDNLLSEVSLQTNIYSTQKSGVCVNTSATEIEKLMGMYL